MRHPTILVADDDSRLLEALSQRLRNDGFEVVTATDGYNALAKAVECAPDVMILDVNMPAGDGFTVLERGHNRAELSDTPVIYLTGDKSTRLDEIADVLGAYATIHKPFDYDRLLNTIRAALLSVPTPPSVA